MTVIYKVDPLKPDIEILKKCASILKSGGLVVFPTETVYGLGADAFNSASVRRVYEIKRRPRDNPLIVHISSFKQLELVVSEIPENAWRLIKSLWPGPLTVVLKKSERVPDVVTAGLPKVGVRMPAHPVALKLIELAETPVVAPSANISGRPSPTTAEHVIQDLCGKVDVIIDTGETLLGIESTVVDLTSDPPTLIRAGPVQVEMLEKLLGTKINIPACAKGLKREASVPRSRHSHYEPGVPLILIEADDYSDLNRLAGEVIKVARKHLSMGRRVAIIASKETLQYYSSLPNIRLIQLGSRSRPYEIAKNLFKVLRSLSSLNVDIAICEGFEEKGLGLAILSRLREASRQNIVKVRTSKA